MSPASVSREAVREDRPCGLPPLAEQFGLQPDRAEPGLHAADAGEEAGDVPLATPCKVPSVEVALTDLRASSSDRTVFRFAETIAPST